uniref:(2Fe-2S)-binding protein n=2 Tax=Pseudomonadota TaxID=1224 RepID=UPI00349FCFB5
MYICVCNAITERQVRASVDRGATSLEDLQFELGVASCCGRCADTALEYLPGGRCS